jgi:hypothetical protein
MATGWDSATGGYVYGQSITVTLAIPTALGEWQRVRGKSNVNGSSYDGSIVKSNVKRRWVKSKNPRAHGRCCTLYTLNKMPWV